MGTSQSMANATNETDYEYDEGEYNVTVDYDPLESMRYYDWVELGPVLVVYTLTFLLGFAGECKSNFKK